MIVIPFPSFEVEEETMVVVTERGLYVPNDEPFFATNIYRR